MRTIKFRCWDKKGRFEMANVEVLDWNDKYVVVDEAWNEDRETGEAECVANFDEIELMQFTGLTDKHGVEIYEGDIVEFNDKWEWYKGAYAIKMLFADNEEQAVLKKKYEAEPMYRIKVEFDPTEGYNLSKYDLSQGRYTIVGNIYENPELI